jgi:RND family efflux transporter MFP subunit
MAQHGSWDKKPASTRNTGFSLCLSCVTGFSLSVLFSTADRKPRRLKAVLALLLVTVACRQEKTPDAVVQTVRSATVEEIRPETPERYSATISPNAQIELAFKSAGLIEQLHQVRGADGRTRDLQAGDFIEEGTELAIVRRLDYEQRVQQAQDQTAQAEAQLAQAEVGLHQADLDFTRASHLYQSASLTKPDYDQAKSRYDSSAAQVAGAKAAVETARNAIAQARLSLADTSLRAPFSGWLTARNVEKGSLVGNSTVGFSMVDTHLVKAIFAVPDTSLKSIRLGQRLSVALDALDQPSIGTVTAVSPQADARTHVFSIEVTMANPGNRIRPGMIGSLTVSAGQVPVPRLVVPLSAVVRAPGNPNGFAVFHLEDRDGKTYVAARPVSPGATYGNSLEVLGGVTEGERIVALGGELLRDGQEVRLLP